MRAADLRRSELGLRWRAATTRAWLVACVVASPAAIASAQEDDRDSGSRASRTARVEAARAAAKEAQADEDERASDRDWDTDYHLSMFGGLYRQDQQPGLLIDAALEENLDVGRQSWSAELSYLYDPFSTKTFNFASDDQDQDVSTQRSRVVQPMHELDAELSSKTKWKKWLRTDTKLQGDGWWPAYRRDRRLSARLTQALRLGRRHGPFGNLAAELFIKKFPRYLVSDRRIDSRGGELRGEGGVDLDTLSVGGGMELTFIDYIDSRYDRLAPDGTVVRATQSKDYLRSSPFINLVLEPHDTVRLSGRYKYQINDARHYARQMTGRDDTGQIVKKLIPGYYDYRRHRMTLRARWRPTRTFRFELVGELWLRDFDNYEARDVDNRWTGALRHDRSLELGFETAYRLLRTGTKAQRHELHLVAFGSHLARSSNMEREVSFSTNFEVTRAFVGLELRGP